MRQVAIQKAFFETVSYNACNMTDNCIKIRSILLQFIKSKKRQPRVNLLGGKTTLLSMLLYTSPVTASAITTNTSSEIHCASTIETMLQELERVAAVNIPLSKEEEHRLTPTPQLFTTPSANADFSPPYILAACLVSTTLTVLLFNLTHHQSHFRYFLSIGIAVSTLVAMTLAGSGTDFVFRYLFFGVNLAMILSAVYHHVAIDSGSAEEGGEEEEIGHFVDEKVAMLN
jgi:hypothetical protein